MRATARTAASTAVTARTASPLRRSDLWTWFPWTSSSQRDGKLLAAGYGGLTRFTADGRLDRSFGAQGGRASAGIVETAAATVQPDRKILVVGTVLTGRTATGDFGVMRLTADGRPDLTYGRHGRVVTTFSPGSDDQAVDGALLANGKLVAAGMTGPIPGSGPYDFAVARYVAVRFCMVPNVRRQMLRAARAAVMRAGCSVGTIAHRYSRTVERGRVIVQRPRPGARRAERTKVHLAVSRGRP